MTAAFPPIHPHPDETAVRALLVAAGLPVTDLSAAHLDDFWGCHDGMNLIGVVGAEYLDPSGSVKSARRKSVGDIFCMGAYSSGIISV